MAGDPRKQTRPKSILVVRHAEKPAAGPDLSDAGKKRAEALPALFKKSPTRPNPFPTPDFIIATKKSDESNRPVETVEPLSKELKLDIDHKIKNSDFARLAEELLTSPKYDGKTVLVCWHHGKIPNLLHALGINPKPGDIGDDVFDRVWIVTFDDKGKAKPLVVQPQALMPNDKKD
jgi:broad specificity phosphatase PhoE